MEAWKDPKIKQYILKLIGVTLRKEISTMCSDKTNSVLMGQAPDFLEGFKWNKLESELDKYAPTLSCLLNSCFTTRVLRQNSKYMLCMCASLMLKNRCPTMSLLQKIISVVLYCGHCSKQVYISTLPECCTTFNYVRSSRPLIVYKSWVSAWPTEAQLCCWTNLEQILIAKLSNGEIFS